MTGCDGAVSAIPAQILMRLSPPSVDIKGDWQW